MSYVYHPSAVLDCSVADSQAVGAVRLSGVGEMILDEFFGDACQCVILSVTLYSYHYYSYKTNIKRFCVSCQSGESG